MTPPAGIPADLCPMCGHEVTSHGAGCAHGWMAPGPECHCPLDSAGQVAVQCALVGCDNVPSRVDSWGQFFCCPDHHEVSAGAVPFADVPSWSNDE